jgi:hypothetical protein
MQTQAMGGDRNTSECLIRLVPPGANGQAAFGHMTHRVVSRLAG